MRKITDKYYVENGQIYKSNGDLVPEDEPLFLIRAKDIAALPTLLDYIQNCRNIAECNKEQIDEVTKIFRKFLTWAKENKDKMKIPNTTKGL